ncbi:MAG: Maf family protein [candidate division WOR-3 bacterium]
MKILLASTSPRRKSILKSLGLKFACLRPSFIEPAINTTTNPKRLATTLALLKALSCTRKIKSGVVLGVDTIVVVNQRILGKPKDQNDARRMIELLSNKTHQVITGIAIIKLPEYKIFTGAEATNVTFRKLTEKEIIDYIKTKEPYDKAGGYALQGRAGLFVKRIQGCYLNVIGLPVGLLMDLLEKLGWRSF